MLNLNITFFHTIASYSSFMDLSFIFGPCAWRVNTTSTLRIVSERLKISLTQQKLVPTVIKWLKFHIITSAFFPKKFYIPVNSTSVGALKTMNTDGYMELFMSNLSDDTLIPTHIKVFGTKYEAGMIVILKRGDCGEMLVGLVRTLSICRENVILGCTVFVAIHSKHGYYVTILKEKDLEVENLCDLADHYPLQRVVRKVLILSSSLCVPKVLNV